MRIYILYSLRDGVHRQGFEERARRVETQLARSSHAVQSYNLSTITGCRAGAILSPYDYIEVLEVADGDAYASEGLRPEVQAFLREWESDVATYITLEGRTVAEI